MPENEGNQKQRILMDVRVWLGIIVSVTVILAVLGIAYARWDMPVDNAKAIEHQGRQIDMEAPSRLCDKIETVKDNGCDVAKKNETTVTQLEVKLQTIERNQSVMQRDVKEILRRLPE